MNLTKQFHSTSRILFGKEIGGLSDFEGYLSALVWKPIKAKSFVSGKEVYLSRLYYAKNAKFISLDEINVIPSGSVPKLDIDDIKDIDSLISAVKENLFYCGNSNIGNSAYVEQSDVCSDATFTLASHQVIRSRNVAYSYGARECENVYGCMLTGEVRFSVRAQVTFKSARCFESYLSINSSDLYCCFNCQGCTDALFSFNQRSKRTIIGNLELPKERYLEMKAKLIGEIADELKNKKRFPPLFELMKNGEENGGY